MLSDIAETSFPMCWNTCKLWLYCANFREMSHIWKQTSRLILSTVDHICTSICRHLISDFFSRHIIFHTVRLSSFWHFEQCAFMLKPFLATCSLFPPPHHMQPWKPVFAQIYSYRCYGIPLKLEQGFLKWVPRVPGNVYKGTKFTRDSGLSREITFVIDSLCC